MNSSMIFGAHKLYHFKNNVLTQQVVRFENHIVADIYPFEREEHSMQWYDVIVFSALLFDKEHIDSIEELLDFTCDSNADIQMSAYLYCVNYENEGCSVLRFE